MREMWEDLFDDVVMSVCNVIHGNESTNPVLQRIVRKALLAECVDQKIRQALRDTSSNALSEPQSL